jgi:hypothetical protein
MSAVSSAAVSTFSNVGGLPAARTSSEPVPIVPNRHVVLSEGQLGRAASSSAASR